MLDRFGKPIGSLTDTIHNTDKGFAVRTYQDVAGVLDGVSAAGQLLSGKSKADGARYLGSVPQVVADVWAKECGAAVGTREFAEHARKKMYDGEFAKLKVDYR